MVNIPYLRGSIEPKSRVAQESQIQEPEEDPELNQELLQAIQLEVARQLSGVPWKTFNEAKKALSDQENAVQDFIKMSVPLSHPEFTKKAMDCLLDKNVYFRLSPQTHNEWNEWNKDFTFNYRLGTEIQWLPPELSVLMQRFVFGEHGQLTGYRATMSSATARDLQLNQQMANEKEMKDRFLQQQFNDLVCWIFKQSQVIDEKTLVSVMT